MPESQPRPPPRSEQPGGQDGQDRRGMLLPPWTQWHVSLSLLQRAEQLLSLWQCAPSQSTLDTSHQPDMENKKADKKKKNSSQQKFRKSQ